MAGGGADRVRRGGCVGHEDLQDGLPLDFRLQFRRAVWNHLWWNRPGLNFRLAARFANHHFRIHPSIISPHSRPLPFAS